MSSGAKVKLMISFTLCCLCVLGFLVAFPGVRVTGILLEALLLFALSYLAWALPARKPVRALGVVVLVALFAPFSVWLSHLVFRKVELRFLWVVQDFCFHIVTALTFLGMTWLVDRGLACAIRRREDNRRSMP